MSEEDIKKSVLKSNSLLSIVKQPYSKKQHPNQQKGLNKYIDVLDHSTGIVNSVKLYQNKKGLHFKKGGNWYLSEFILDYLYVPYQIIKVDIEVWIPVRGEARNCIFKGIYWETPGYDYFPGEEILHPEMCGVEYTITKINRNGVYGVRCVS